MLHTSNYRYNETLQPFHIVDPSGWPALMSITVFSFFSILFFILQKLNTSIITIIICLLFASSVFFNWFTNIIEENLIGHHTMRVEAHFYMAIVLFIASEVMFFFSFFWALFHFSLAPNIYISVWPPISIPLISMNIITLGNLPGLNTLILLTSGATVTLSHYSLLIGDRRWFITWLNLTIILGLFFTLMQFIEYKYLNFTIQDSTYGSIFYLVTGFHGFHVIVGTTLLICCVFRDIDIGGYTSSNHFSFEAAAWYWHFVDVVWLFLFICLYIWPTL